MDQPEAGLAPSQLLGLKYLERVLPLLERLRPAACARDKAHNRRLFFDHYCALLLLYCFNPMIQSLRGLQRASQLEQVQRKLGARRASLGSLSEAARVFDPALLEPLLEELLGQLPAALPRGPLAEIAPTLVAVDGTLLKSLPQITQACYGTRRDQGWRLHTHFEILRGIPLRMDVTNATNSKAANEKAVLRKHLQADRCYVLDRGYEEFALYNAIVAAGSSYVGRIRQDHHFTPTAARPLSAEAQAAGVVEDAVGHLGSPRSVRIEHPDHPVRRIVVEVEVHPKRPRRPGRGPTQRLVIATNLLAVPAEVLAALYRGRWLIELFFRFLKQVLGCRRLLSEHPQGIQIQCYCALIACLLINLTTGRKPTLATYEMLGYFFLGLATEAELLSHLQKLKTHDA